MGSMVLRIVGWGSLGLIACLVVIGLIKPWGMGIDFANFYDAGQKARAGEFASLYNPFALIAGQEPLSHMTFFSAPITSFLYAPLATLPPRMALVVFKTLGTVSMIIGLVLLYRESLLRTGRDPRQNTMFFAMFAAAALLFQPFWTIYRVGGQTTPFVFLLLVLGYMAYLRASFVLTALIFGLIVLIKPVFGPAALLLFLISSNGFRLTALSSAALVAGVSVHFLGWDLHREFLARILDENAILLRPWLNSSPFSWIEPFFVAPETYRTPGQLPETARLGLTALRLCVVAALVWAMVRQRALTTEPEPRRHHVYVTGLLLVVVISPVVWAHYLSVLFIPLVFLIARHDRLPTGALWVFGLATAFSFFQNLYLIQKLEILTAFDTRPEIIMIGLLKSLPALLFVLGSLWYWRHIAAALTPLRPLR